MSVLASVAVVIVAALHLAFLVLEMFLWDTPFGRRAFGLTRERAQATRTLAANQGLYNGFLAAGLLWALWPGIDARAIATFFLVCVVVAGIYGAATVNRRIFWIQGAPALLALALVHLT